MKKKITRTQKALLERLARQGVETTAAALRADPQDLRNLYLHGKIAVSNPKDAPQDWRVKAAA